MKKVFALLGSVIISSAAMAAGGTNPGESLNAGPIPVPTDGIVDGVVITQHIPTKRMIPYEHVREADMMWSKRTWDYIDLREKINHSLYYPLDEIKMLETADGKIQQEWIRNTTRHSLWTVIRGAIIRGELMVFSPFNPLDEFLSWEQDGDQLKYPITPVTGRTYFTDNTYRDKIDMVYLGNRKILNPPKEFYEADGITIIQVPVRDQNGVPVPGAFMDSIQKYEADPYTSEDIVQYRLKEDWFFDKERSVLDVRIIALAPVVYDVNNGQIKGLRELFWLYFPHCRFVFNNYFVYNDRNDSQWMSFDDLFWKRRFSYVTYKASNTYDRDIESYRHGIDALYESEEIKKEIRLIEHDVWSF